MPDLQVVGRHRKTHRYVTMILDGAWLGRFRADLVYSPEVIRLLGPRFDGSSQWKLYVENLADLYMKSSVPANN
jgi:hypothetical protein